jgi:periplasmic divalent cation tolerance protein
MPAKSDPVLVLSTAPAEDAKRIAKNLVESRLAACVNVMAVQSFYRWEGQFCEDKETLMIIKTVSGRIDPLIARIRELHPYDLPEMIVIPITGGNPPYLDWLRSETVI